MIGEVIGHYRLEAELGRGAFGTVYRASHVEDPDLCVAIKVIHPQLQADPEFVASLKRECRQLDRLDHPNIVRFRDLVVAPGVSAIVLELLAGATLDARFHGRPADLEETRRILEAILSALAHAHARGVIHRDIKPSNIFLCDDGRVKVLDFGIAKAADEAKATKTGTIAGTLDYMAPECFSGKPGPAADVYAAGLVAWETLTGKAACPEGAMPEKMGWHLGVGAPHVRTIRTDVPDGLDAAVHRMTRPEARPQNGEEALAILASLSASGAPQPPPPQPPPVAKRPDDTVRISRPKPEAAEPPPTLPRVALPLAGIAGGIGLAVALPIGAAILAFGVVAVMLWNPETPTDTEPLPALEFEPIAQPQPIASTEPIAEPPKPTGVTLRRLEELGIAVAPPAVTPPTVAPPTAEPLELTPIPRSAIVEGFQNARFAQKFEEITPALSACCTRFPIFYVPFDETPQCLRGSFVAEYASLGAWKTSIVDRSYAGESCENNAIAFPGSGKWYAGNYFADCMKDADLSIEPGPVLAPARSFEKVWTCDRGKLTVKP